MNVYDYYITPEEYQLAEKNGITRGCLEERIRRLGWDKEKAMHIKKQEREKIYCKRIKGIAKENGISLSLLRYRIKTMGLSPYESATKEIEDPKEQFHRIRFKTDKYNKELRELANRNGISKELFYYRINKMGLSEYNSATRPKRTKEDYSREATERNKKHAWRSLNNLICNKI